MDQPLTRFPAVASLRQAAASERRISNLLRRRQKIRLRADAQKAEIDRKLAQGLAPLEREIYERAARIEEFASHRRQKLTENGKTKTVLLPDAGEFHWVFNPPALIVANLKEAIGSIRSKGLGVKRFLRVRYELNKEALLEAPDTARKVDGASIVQEERFVIAPAHTGEKVERNLRTLEWSITSPKKREPQQ